MGTSLQTLRGISFVNLTYKQVGFRICLCFESRVNAFGQSSTLPQSGEARMAISVHMCSYGTVTA